MQYAGGNTLSTRLLSSTFPLHDVDDVEAVCRSVLTGYCAKTQTALRPDDREDALAFLIAAAYELSLRWDPGRGIRFTVYLRPLLTLRVTDWHRQTLGRTTWKFATFTYTRDRTVPLSLDAPAHADGGGPRASLADSLPAVESDSEMDSPAFGGGLLDLGGVAAAQDFERLREVAARRVEERAEAARERALERNLSRKSPNKAA